MKNIRRQITLAVAVGVVSAIAIETPRAATCPKVPTRAGFRQWVWESVLAADAALQSALDVIAEYRAKRIKDTTLEAEKETLRFDFAEVAGRGSHALNQGKNAANGVVDSFRKAVRLIEKEAEKLQERIDGNEKIRAQIEKRIARGKGKDSKKVDRKSADLKKLLQVLEGLRKRQDELRSAFCKVVTPYREPYEQALAPKIATYKEWYRQSAEQKKLFDTDPEYQKLHYAPMTEPDRATKNKAIPLAKGLRGSGVFGPEMVDIFLRVKAALGGAKSPFSSTQYGPHSWGEYSSDIWISTKCPPGTTICFIPREKLLAFFRAMLAAEKASRVRWRALYNDFEVAKIISQEAGVRKVLFQWIHGPGPYKDHIHIDFMPVP